VEFSVKVLFELNLRARVLTNRMMLLMPSTTAFVNPAVIERRIPFQCRLTWRASSIMGFKLERIAQAYHRFKNVSATASF
jgi:hypothetical protein